MTAQGPENVPGQIRTWGVVGLGAVLPFGYPTRTTGRGHRDHARR